MCEDANGGDRRKNGTVGQVSHEVLGVPPHSLSSNCAVNALFNHFAFGGVRCWGPRWSPQELSKGAIGLLKGLLVAVVLVATIGCATNERPVILVGSGDLVYPESARKQELSGFVTVRYDVSAEGAISNVVVVESEPPGVFDEAVLAYVRTWMFLPATKAGEPIAQEGLESTVRLSVEDDLLMF